MLAEAKQQLISDISFYRTAGSQRMATSTISRLDQYLATHGQPVWAGQLWGSAEEIRAQIGSLQWSCDAAIEQSRIAVASTQIVARHWHAAWAAGALRNWEQTVDQLLSRAQPKNQG